MDNECGGAVDVPTTCQFRDFMVHGASQHSSGEGEGQGEGEGDADSDFIKDI